MEQHASSQKFQSQKSKCIFIGLAVLEGIGFTEFGLFYMGGGCGDGNLN